MLPGVETRGLNPVVPSASGQKADYRRAILSLPGSTTAAEELSRNLPDAHAVKASTLSLHLLFRTPFIVEARRLLKEIIDSA